MENIAPHTQADLEFIDYIKDFKFKLNQSKKEYSGRNEDDRELSEAFNTLYHEFYFKISERRILPKEETHDKTQELSHCFHSLLCQMVAYSMKNFKKGSGSIEPKLNQSMTQLLKWNSYNPML